MKNFFIAVLFFVLGLWGKDALLFTERRIKHQTCKISNIPQHIGIIMDGNGRWAQRQNQKREYGHQHAHFAVEAAMNACHKYGVKYLTLYAFSTENWKRPPDEINAIFETIHNFLRAKKDEAIKNKIRLNVFGQISRLPQALQNDLVELMELTKDFDTLQVNFCIDYGGRWDIINACNKILQNKEIDVVTAENFSQNLSSANIPDPDIIIRTGGERRISGFLTWESVYSEFFFVDKFWPDFTEEDITSILIDYQERERRFGDSKK